MNNKAWFDRGEAVFAHTYTRFPAVMAKGEGCRLWDDNGKEYAVDNKFHLPSFTKDIPTRTYVIVSYDYNVVTLYIIKQELPSALEDNCVTPHTRVVMQNGVVIVETDHGCYTLQGEKIF